MDSTVVDNQSDDHSDDQPTTQNMDSTNDTQDPDVCERTTSPLASIQQIQFLHPIPDKDRIVMAQVLGYRVIVNRNDFNFDENKEQLCVFFEPDALLDSTNPVFAFMESRKFRVRTIKFGTSYSQGLAMKLETWGELSSLPAGTDVTKLTKTTKYISKEEQGQYAIVAGRSKGRRRNAAYYSRAPKDPRMQRFPEHRISKTDEVNVQSAPFKWTNMVASDATIVVTEKIDGCSGTFAADFIASRNFQHVEVDGTYHQTAKDYVEANKKYDIVNQLKAFPTFIIQGEIYGPGINHNRLKETELKFAVFNIWDTASQTYLPWGRVKEVCAQLHLPHVPELWTGRVSESPVFSSMSVEDLLNFVEPRKYPAGTWAEGIVIKTETPTKGNEASFKVISRNYLVNKKE